MNGERGVDLQTIFERSYVVTSITEEKTTLLRNNKTLEYIFTDSPTIKEDYTNYHLHLLFPETKNKKNNVKGFWSVEYIESYLKVGNFPESQYKTVIYDPDTNSPHCKRILASTEMLMGVKPDWDKNDYSDNPYMDTTKWKDVDNICNSLVEVYVQMQGKLEYVMVHPYHSSRWISDLDCYSESVEYKKDINDFIAVFPAVTYNKAALVSQIH